MAFENFFEDFLNRLAVALATGLSAKIFKAAISKLKKRGDLIVA
jgi:hypothetical protein